MSKDGEFAGLPLSEGNFWVLVGAVTLMVGEAGLTEVTQEERKAIIERVPREDLQSTFALFRALVNFLSLGEEEHQELMSESGHEEEKEEIRTVIPVPLSLFLAMGTCTGLIGDYLSHGGNFCRPAKQQLQHLSVGQVQDAVSFVEPYLREYAKEVERHGKH